MAKAIKVLIIDDSEFVREVLSLGLEKDPKIEIVGAAADAYEARDKIVALKPDVLTLDIDMPRMNGVDFLKKLMPQYPLPVVIVSSLAEPGSSYALDALSAGAIDIVTKPQARRAETLDAMMVELRTKIKIASAVDVSHLKRSREVVFQGAMEKKPAPDSRCSVIAIGASTGGTEAIAHILRNLPQKVPGILIVQHMPPVFTKMFAERINHISALDVREATDGDRVIPGRALIAPGKKHMALTGDPKDLKVSVKEGELVSGHCPSVDVLFRSVAETVGKRAIGMILTGMGHDGAQGLKKMRELGARTLGQNEESCVVYGMPKVASERGAVERMVSLADAPNAILELLGEEW